MKNKYRINKCSCIFGNYQAEVKYWWWPFCWWECYGVNTRRSISEATAVARRHSNGISEFNKFDEKNLPINLEL